MADSSHALFAFGTLLDPDVQAGLFGRPVPTRSASLAGCRLVDVQITDPRVIALSGLAVHRGLKRDAAGSVPGGVLFLDDAQLASADAYEVSAYARRRVHLTDGMSVWAYLAANPFVAAERIAVIGDSIAYGRCDPSGGWAQRLAAHHVAADEASHRVFALAIPGQRLDALRPHLDEVVRRRPDTVVVAAGINDLAGAGGAASTPDDLLAEVEALCTDLEGHDIRPVVVTPLWVDEAAAREDLGLTVTVDAVVAYRSTLMAWAERTHRDVLDLWPVSEGRPDLLVDGVHPGPEGHQALWERLRVSA